MLRSIYSKFIIGYILFGLIGFLAVAFFAQNMTYDYLVGQAAENLYGEAVLMAATYEDESSYLTDVHGNTAYDLTMVSEFLDVSIWIVSPEGRIILDTSGEYEAMVAEGFDPAMGSEVYRIGDFYGMFDTATLSVMAPVNHNFTTIGYIVIHYPMSKVVESTNEILNIVYLTAMIIFLLSFVILLVFTAYVYIPLRKITAGAKEYAAGHLDYRIDTGRSRDEVSYLGNTLNFMASTIDDAERAQREFVSNVSHDFRSPLTSIRGYLEAILDGTIPHELEEKYLRRVISEADRLSKLTEDMISLGAIGIQNHVRLSVFDINDTIRDVCAANENACVRKNIHFELIFEDTSENVLADEGKIKQVLYNLIDNAIKFSDSGSAIVISTSARQRKVLVSIKDSGTGIPKRSIKKIWDRFYKSDTSRGRDRTGTGLGLSIVKEIIQLHGENIDVVSTEGVGSEFTFTLSMPE